MILKIEVNFIVVGEFLNYGVFILRNVVEFKKKVSYDFKEFVIFGDSV